jgi:8-oxo-dGTP diphosphatase
VNQPRVNPASSGPTADCIRGVVGVIEQHEHFLLIKRSRFVRAPGKWCFPGGAIEPGESVEHAIVRECREELGIEVAAAGSLWQWLRADGKLHLVWQRVHWLGGVLRPNFREVAAVRWMNDAEVRSHPEMIPNNVTFLDAYRAGGRVD